MICREGVRVGGLFARVSSQHKWRKLPTSLLHSWAKGLDHSHAAPHFLLSPVLCSVLFVQDCAFRLQMLDPAVRLPGHMVLQLFIWTCFASKHTLKGPSCFFTTESVCSSLNFQISSLDLSGKEQNCLPTTIFIVYCISNQLNHFYSVDSE